MRGNKRIKTAGTALLKVQAMLDRNRERGHKSARTSGITEAEFLEITNDPTLIEVVCDSQADEKLPTLDRHYIVALTPLGEEFLVRFDELRQSRKLIKESFIRMSEITLGGILAAIITKYFP